MAVRFGAPLLTAVYNPRPEVKVRIHSMGWNAHRHSLFANPAFSD